ncbi:hypothetical protein SLEP1_g59041 [Rubroshorea leprosula]|uniref:Cytochrome P450 n=1 Tax=Rubroshorea leprosula TaxID=152421 RepID=A0AAV5MU03_9ROSI|nr:hypothetical protein SLEP1_g59041 [Rubroshorea leprosula]
MDITSTLFVLLSIFLLSAALILPWRQRRCHQNGSSPPGPPGWPFFGNIFDLGATPHQMLYELKPKYGPVLWLKLGSVNTLVIQSAEAAAELFKNHDQVFCDRRIPASLTAHNFNQGGISLGKYSRPYWRMLRRLYATELMVNRRINDLASVRQKCINNMIRFMEEDAAVMEWGAMPNVVDFFPALKWLDPQGIKRNMEKEMGRALKIISKFVKQRIEEKELGKEKQTKDLLDVLLEHQSDGKDGDDELNEQKVIIFILEMFFAGSDTNSATIEWAMAELLRKPDSMRKAKEELDRVIGPNRKVEESDVEELHYLQAVIKETLRLHPPVPLLLPRNCIEDTHFMGYFIPKDTQLWVNVWAIGRDLDTWEDPLLFKPERFLDSKIDYKGQNFELIPFGSGRRICPGVALGHRVLHLTLATLLHCFDWELSNNTTSGQLDMSEKTGIAIRKHVPLKAIPKKRVMKCFLQGLKQAAIPYSARWQSCSTTQKAIGRDPDAWEDPSIFEPERLLHLGLASLLHYFDLELPINTTPADVDMNERNGIAVRKLVPLKVIPNKEEL